MRVWLILICVAASLLCVEAIQRRSCRPGEYWHKHHRLCRECPNCSQGYRLAKPCGHNGEGYPARCKACTDDQYVEIRGKWDHLCWQCTDCRNHFRTTLLPCKSNQDTKCGGCLPGHYNKYEEDATDKDEAYPCSPCAEWPGKC